MSKQIVELSWLERSSTTAPELQRHFSQSSHPLVSKPCAAACPERNAPSKRPSLHQHPDKIKGAGTALPTH